MPRRLPSLTSLRAFEAAARHLSFTRAANELAVTQAAISHQVKALENDLGLALFVRLPRKLMLTRAGEQLLSKLSFAFDDIVETVNEMKRERGRASLTIRLAPSFSARWLSPRLATFRDLHPEIELRLNHSNQAVDFSREDVDLGITYGNGDWPGVVADPVLSLDFFPVCNPDLLNGANALETPYDLRHHTLLHDGTYENWSAWLAIVGETRIKATSGTILDDTNVLIQAAADGQGVALGSTAFVGQHLASGKIAKPFEITLESDLSYYVVCPVDHLKRPGVIEFKNWLSDQAQ